MILRYVKRHISRAMARSLLSLVLAASLIAALGQYVAVVRGSRDRVERMYDTVDVYANVVNRSGSVGTNIPYGAIEILLDVDFSSRYYAESRGPLYWVTPSHEEVSTIYNIIDPEEFGRAADITYADGYDASIFLESTDAVCFVSEKALEEFDLSIGDVINISGASFGERNKPGVSVTGKYGPEFTIIGTFRTGLGAYDILTPFWSMKTSRFPFYIGSYAGSGMARLAEFRVKNELLHDSAAYKDTPNEALASAKSTDISGLALRVLDSEVTNVIEPLSRNTDLLEMLLPVICIVVLIIGAAIPGLIIIQSAKEAAIMRVLGTPKTRVRLVLTAEQLLLCLIGLIIGTVGLAAAHGFGENLMPYITEILLYALGYALLCAAVCYGCAVSVSANKPLELLQVKE